MNTMHIPGFTAEAALNNSPATYRSTGNSRREISALVSPQQTLFPPGTPVFTCSPSCTWGPPMVQTCCAEICIFGSCFPICFTKMAPLCPQ